VDAVAAELAERSAVRPVKDAATVPELQAIVEGDSLSQWLALAGLGGASMFVYPIQRAIRLWLRRRLDAQTARK
jgi:hypothetical protein